MVKMGTQRLEWGPGSWRLGPVCSGGSSTCKLGSSHLSSGSACSSRCSSLLGLRSETSGSPPPRRPSADPVLLPLPSVRNSSTFHSSMATSLLPSPLSPLPWSPSSQGAPASTRSHPSFTHKPSLAPTSLEVKARALHVAHKSLHELPVPSVASCPALPCLLCSGRPGLPAPQVC